MSVKEKFSTARFKGSRVLAIMAIMPKKPMMQMDSSVTEMCLTKKSNIWDFPFIPMLP